MLDKETPKLPKNEPRGADISMQCQAGAWLAQRYKLLQLLFQDGPMEYWQAQWQDPAGYGGEAILQIPLAIFFGE